VNHKFATCLMEYLQTETYLEKNGKTIRSIIENQTIIFENEGKRIIDVVKHDATLEPVFIDDLREDPKNNQFQNRLCLQR
jgi:hypothetical protein